VTCGTAGGEGAESQFPGRLRAVVGGLAGAEFPWWVAGGYAIELALGRTSRSHDDLDLMMLRRDRHRVCRRIAAWDPHLVMPETDVRRPWLPTEELPPRVRTVRCRRGPGDAWSLEVMLGESAGDMWVSGRHPRVRRSLAELGRVSAAGVPYLSPAVCLFHKAENPRPKDTLDFEAVLPVLGIADRMWLLRCLELVRPDHPWRTRLARDLARSARPETS
jgi:aminoglycoside-2''-adenylyltransferase